MFLMRYLEGPTDPGILLGSRALAKREYESGEWMKSNLFLDVFHFPFSFLETELPGHQREVWHLSKGTVLQNITFTKSVCLRFEPCSFAKYASSRWRFA